MKRVSPHFSEDEFYVSATYPEIARIILRTKEDRVKHYFITHAILEPLREHIGLGVKILSGKRSPELNEKVRGVKGSNHLWEGFDWAVDFDFIYNVNGHKSGRKKDEILRKAYDFLYSHMKYSLGQMILYLTTDQLARFIHISNPRGKEVETLYKWQGKYGLFEKGKWRE